MSKMVDKSSCGFLVLFLILVTSCLARNLKERAEVTEDDLRKLAAANNELARNIYRQITAGSTENVFFSPLSLSSAFGLLYYGTRGDTAEELRKALGYENAGLEESSVPRTFRKYLTEILPSQDTAAYTLSSANAVILDKKVDLVPDYKSAVEDYYQASVKDVDFATQGPEVVRQINEWVQEKTHGKIDKILDRLSPSTLFFLLNAVYFKGTWKTQFDPSKTRLSTFYNNGLESSAKKINMMRLTEEFLYLVTEDVHVLEMPYKGENVSMVILLPKEVNGLESLEKSLTVAKLSALRRQLVKREVDVTIPKFKLEYSREVSRDFQTLGAKKIFTPEADFSGITTSNGDIAISQVLHKAVIEVNEEGSEAAAVTIYGPLSIDPDFTVDRPFLFTILDRKNDMILFMGRVTNL